ncbi:enolase C-terminal domain-like protein [Actinokineospora bangkokensis]|uniref:Dipeptide epimerase n=1 Tax=Actinokineospora bangkokensis TaxID=1193682 RepID=A0A1Q9LRX9_9PSEU|nr:enolase C-terminal domain-like protein [Actinokineospora bangkokensis]OLR94770.1 dipeptide epimerase [Actinokineospora bangkokensis]
MKLVWGTRELVLREPFRISRAVMTGRTAVEVVVEHRGHLGRGEVVTSGFHRLDVPGITAVLTGWQPVVERVSDPADLLDLLPAGPPGVRAACDAAVHDLLGRIAGKPLHELLGLPEWTDVPTACTIGITPPSEAAAKAEELVGKGFRVLKVKAGDEQDEARLRVVRHAAPDARLLLDPNGAWTPEQAVRFLDRTADLRLDAVEQPTAPGNPDRLAWVAARTAVPVVADEDAATAHDVRGLGGAVAGVNVKLVKCGGVRAAREVLAAAAAGGLDVMLGCLVASSLGIAPAAHLAARARWVDLDGHLLLDRDPWTGIGGEGGLLRPSGLPGLGVLRR